MNSERVTNDAWGICVFFKIRVKHRNFIVNERLYSGDSLQAVHTYKIVVGAGRNGMMPAWVVEIKVSTGASAS